jgi:hypothetical protein
MRKSCLALAVLAFSVPAFASESSATDNEAVNSSYGMLAAAPADFVQAKRELAAGNYGTAARLLEYLADGSLDPAMPLLAGYANLGAGRVGRAELYFGRTLGLDSRSAEAQVQLATLEEAQRRCANTCSRAEALGRAVTSLRRVLH